jgi:hypothetical protein
VAFDPAATGTIVGRVGWAGPEPTVPAILAPLSTGSEGQDHLVRSWANPHAPEIDRASRGVGGTVLFLRKIEPGCGRPWDLPPVEVEIEGGQFHVRQGGKEQRVGFVHPGDGVTMVSREPWFEILQARGAAFFSLPLPESGLVRTRHLKQPGHVEFVSGAGHYWMRGHVFVVTHPYYTVTDTEGRFTLDQVPAGRHELVCWHPNWHVASLERDLGTLLYVYATYHQSVEIVQTVQVEPGRTSRAAFTLRAAQFAPEQVSTQ